MVDRAVQSMSLSGGGQGGWRNLLSLLAPRQMGAPLLLVLMLAMMTLPLPPILLDLAFSFNIAVSLVVMLVVVYTMRPLEFTIFPSILLVATLLRLALNVASTRVVLLHGHSGGDAAGKVIQSFGEVVIGGNYAVGLVVFLILIIINFVVVTKGATRISEVSARFTLDAMPGKQMAIDADLNAGLIDQDEAKQRREEVGQEADFYGAMDGASKFVRGDAVAGLLILMINILGGLAIGTLQHDLTFAEAMRVYALLTIGDGLVAQIPSLLLSTAAAIIVTRVSSAQDMSGQVMSQLFGTPVSLAVAAAILAVIGLVPGMPHMAFLGFAAVCGYGAWWINRNKIAQSQAAQMQAQVDKPAPEPPELRDLTWSDVRPVDAVGLEVGYRLIALVDRQQAGPLLARIKGIRRKLSQELGFLVPTVHIRDNLELQPDMYRILLRGVTVAEANVYPDRELAINPGQVFGEVQGIPAKDPAFGLDAVWIAPAHRDQAQSLGFTVVDASTVVATHLNHIMYSHASEFLGHEEVQKLVDQLSDSAPRLVEHLVPSPLPLSTLLKVLQNLLKERVSIRDFRVIAEALAEEAVRTQNTDELTSAARVALSRQIVQGLIGHDDVLPVMTLDPSLENILNQSVQQARQQGGKDGDAVLEPGMAERLQQSLSKSIQEQEIKGQTPVLLVSSSIRTMMVKFSRYSFPDLSVLSFNEIPENKQITIVASIGHS